MSNEPDWEKVARDALYRLTVKHWVDIEETLPGVSAKVEDGNLTADYINDVRNALLMFEIHLEERIVPLVEGVESWERGSDGRPAWVFWDALGIDRETHAEFERWRHGRESNEDPR